jgi:GNAT superfamily N-acetyltransferase
MPAMPTTIRPMTDADVEPAAATVLAGGWGDRRTFFRFTAAHPGCRSFVAADDDGIAGTGVGTVNGIAGWVGTIFVAPSRRGTGLGRALTQAVIDALEEAGCRTLLLIASREGLPVYERMGFAVETHYRILEAAATRTTGSAVKGDAGSARAGTVHVRAFAPEDLEAMAALDRAATGEDRAHLLRALASPASTRCVTRDGGISGFLLRPPWPGGATIAPLTDDAVALLEDRRRQLDPDDRLRTGVLESNETGVERLRSAGWTEAWTAPRLIRGDPLAWNPGSIWGQLQYAMG